MLPPIPRAPPFSKEEVLNAAKKFLRASAAGISGFSPTHLLELLQAPDADCKNGLREAFAAGLGNLTNGKGPPDLAPWLAGAPVGALLLQPDRSARVVAERAPTEERVCRAAGRPPGTPTIHASAAVGARATARKNTRMAS
eukprot:IDg5479t1